MRTPTLVFAILTGWLLALPASGQSPHNIYRPGIDVTDYEISLDLPETGNVSQGRPVRPVRRSKPLDTLTLDLLSLRVDTVLVNGRAAAFKRDSSTIRIPLPKGSNDSLAGAVRDGGPVTDALIIRNDSAWGWTAFGDNWPNRGRHWIPSIDHPSAKATVTWIVRAPSNRKVVANGARLEETPIPGSSPE